LDGDGVGEALAGDRDQVWKLIEVEGEAGVVLAVAGAMGLEDDFLDVLPAIVKAGDRVEGVEAIGVSFANAE
jgi:hypothetical protein